MSTELSFQLFGDGGIINPTPWSYASQDPSRSGQRWSLCFYDHASGRFVKKQTSDFDGGWRWFDSSDTGGGLTVYNVKLDRRAYADIPILEIQNTCLGAELVLLCVKSRVLIEHNYYSSLDYVNDTIRALFKQARVSVLREISGEPHLHSV